MEMEKNKGTVPALLEYLAKRCWESESGMCFVEDLDDLRECGFGEADLEEVEDFRDEHRDFWDVVELQSPEGAEACGDPMVTAYQSLPMVVAEFQGALRRPDVAFECPGGDFEKAMAKRPVDPGEALAAVDEAVRDSAAFIVQAACIDDGVEESPAYCLVADRDAWSVDYGSMDALIRSYNAEKDVAACVDPSGDNIAFVGRNKEAGKDFGFVLHQLDDVHAWIAVEDDPEKYVKKPELLAEDFHDPKCLQQTTCVDGLIRQVEDYRAGRLVTYTLDEVGEMLGLDDLEAARDASAALGGSQPQPDRDAPEETR